MPRGSIDIYILLDKILSLIVQLFICFCPGEYENSTNNWYDQEKDGNSDSFTFTKINTLR